MTFWDDDFFAVEKCSGLDDEIDNQKIIIRTLKSDREMRYWNHAKQVKR